MSALLSLFSVAFPPSLTLSSRLEGRGTNECGRGTLDLSFETAAVQPPQEERTAIGHDVGAR
jgi:hypothetical protein